MYCLTFNYKGLSHPSMKLFLMWLIETHNPYIIYFQELLIEGVKTVKDISNLLKGWDFSFVDVIG